MSIATIITMVITVGAVWGGFAFILMTALKKEQAKSDHDLR